MPKLPRAGEKYLSAPELQDHDAASRCFAKVLEIDPDNLYAHGYLAQLESRRRHFDAAVKHGRLVVTGAPENAKARFRLANDLYEAGQVLESRQEMRRLAESPGPEANRARQWLEHHTDRTPEKPQSHETPDP